MKEHTRKDKVKILVKALLEKKLSTSEFIVKKAFQSEKEWEDSVKQEIEAAKSLAIEAFEASDKVNRKMSKLSSSQDSRAETTALVTTTGKTYAQLQDNESFK